MPHENIHQERKVKNFILLGLFLLLVLVIFAITLQKLQINYNDSKAVKKEEYHKVNEMKQDIIKTIKGSN
jgi:di/tricarboxylate transporter